MNAELRTILSAHLSSVSLRCSRLDTDDTQIHVNGFLRAHLRRCSFLDAGGNQISNNDHFRAILRGEEIRALRREFSAALLTLYVMGLEPSFSLGIHKLSQQFSSGLQLRNVQPASEDDMLLELGRVSSATSTVFLELTHLRLGSGQFVLDLMSHVQQACRRRILELKSKCAVGVQTAITPLVPWSTRSASDSFYVQHVMLPDPYTLSADTMYSLRTISERDDAGTGAVLEKSAAGVAGASALPKRLNDYKGWKRLHYALAEESACLSPAERQRRYNQVMALGNGGSTSQTEVYHGMQLVASPEVDVDDDFYQEDPRIVEAHSRLDVLTEYLGSIPGFEDYCTALEVEDLHELEGDADSKVDDRLDSVEDIPDDLIEDWLDDQVEGCLDLYAGFLDACCQDACETGWSCGGDDGWSGKGCSGDGDNGYSDDSDNGSQEMDDGYSDDGNEEDALHYGYEEDTPHYDYQEDVHH
jgi:hypothetical protein